MLIHKYTEKDLTLSLEASTTLSSRFGDLLVSQWEDAMRKGVFRYKLTKNGLPFKILPGRFNYIAQLNTDRAEKRRQPQEMLSEKQPFNPDLFNFNKVPDNEVLLRLEPYWSSSNEDEHLVLVNISPLEYCHVLITPFRDQNRVQKVTLEGLRLALELSLQSPCDIRVGLNSLCGFASVNHEHWHLYHLSHRLFLESASLKKVLDGKECYELDDKGYPPCFCFILKNVDDLSKCLENVLRLTAYIWENEIAHNVFITRGSSENRKGHFDCVRVFVWVRVSSFGAKRLDGFNPACIELAGHFPIRAENSYNILTEEYALNELHAICDEPFQRVRSWILEQF